MSSGSQILARTAHLLRTLSRFIDGYGWQVGTALTVQFYGRRTPKTVSLSGGGSPPLFARSGRGQTDAATLLHVWSERCYHLDLSSDPAWIIDAGANAGYATVWFALRFPSATVIAIEPDPGNLELLRRNTEGLANVRLVNAALMSEPGSADLIDTGSGPWAMRVGAAGAGAGNVVGMVRCVSMPQILDEFGIDRVGYLKIDIEGGEVEVLNSSGPWMDRVDAIAIELHDRFRSGASRAFVNATSGFAQEFSRGENSFVVRTASN